MGSTQSSLEPKDIVGEQEQDNTFDDTLQTIQVQYGPNIVGQLLGYDQETRNLSQAAHTLYQAISKPSNQNKHKAQILLNDIHSNGIEQGRSSVSLSEIERDFIDDIEYKVFLHKKTYGIRDINDVDKKFNLQNMDSVCNNFKQQIENCLRDNTDNNTLSIPYYNHTFSALNCGKEMDLYNNCVSNKLSGIY